MKLYNSNLSPFASRARLAIYAKGLQVDILPPPGGLQTEQYRAINPIGRVPALALDDGTVIPESEVIVEYLDEAFPQPPLLPSAAPARAKARLLGRMVDLYLMPGMLVLFQQAGVKERNPSAIADAIGNVKKGLGLIEHFIENGSYAVGGRMSVADCALVPILFFVTGMLPRMGEPAPFGHAPKLARYWDAIAKDANAAKILGEMKQALAERMAKAS